MVNEMLLWFARLTNKPLHLAFRGSVRAVSKPKEPLPIDNCDLGSGGLDHTTSFEVPEGQRHSGSLHAEHHRQKLVC